jgi:hypothetical protein
LIDGPSELYYVVNWSLPGWVGPGFPTPGDEAFIGRSPVNGPIMVEPVDPLINPFGQWVELYYVIPDYNPEWVSIDIYGMNIKIENELRTPPMESPLYSWWLQNPQKGGILLHECLPKPMGDVSLWAGPLNFTTLCLPIAILPYTQGFEGATWPPVCWTDPVTAAYGWAQDVYGGPNSGLHWAYCNLAGSELYAPELNITDDLRMVFWYRAEGASYPQDMQVKIDGDVVYTITGAINTTYQRVEIPLNAYSGQTIVVSFLGQTGTGGTAWGICVDDFNISSYSNTWTGAVSTAWTTPDNWSAGVVPGTGDHVTIPSAPVSNRFPLIGSGVTANCHDINVETGATVTVATGGTLNIVTP